MLMALGPFRFAVQGIPMTEMERRTAARHGSVPVQGRAPSLHYMGPDNDLVAIKAELYPRFLGGNGLTQVEGMRQSARAGIPYPLVSLSGLVFGTFIISKVNEYRLHHDPTGMPQKLDLKLELRSFESGGFFGGAGSFTARLF